MLEVGQELLVLHFVLVILMWRRRLVEIERDVEMTQEELEELLKDLPMILEELEKYNVVKDKPPLKKI